MMLVLAQVTDPNGVTGTLFDYMTMIFYMGSAILIFLYLWRKGRLDMDEEPKNQMMQDDEENKNVRK